MFGSLPEFIKHLEKNGQLVRVSEPVSTILEMTEIGRRMIEKNGPAVIIENPVTENGPSNIPVLINLFGTVERVAMALGRKPSELRELGELLAFLKQPEPPAGIGEMRKMLPILKKALNMRPKRVKKAECQQVVLTGDDIDLGKIPIQTCWPGEPAPLISWPLVVTKGSGRKKTDNYNLGIYRMQVLNKNQTLMRWLKHRGGAAHHRQFREPMPCAVVIGADPATILGAVTPVPDTLSEYQFAGLLRDSRTKLVKCKTIDLEVPASAEIVLEGHVSLNDYRDEGPYGDHTGYYNSVEQFPVFTISAITMKKKPVYHSTYTSRPPDECSVLGESLNELFVPLLTQQYPEIVDFWLPPEGCSYRVAVISIKKTYPGQARRVMMGVWSFLRQFVYTKFLIVVDEGVNVRDWNEVIAAVSANMHPVSDAMTVEQTPIDYLDFASPVSGLGGKLGMDATRKMGGEIIPDNVKIEVAPLKEKHPEIIDFWLPPEAESSRVAVISVKKTHAGQAQKLMADIWEHSPISFVIVVDEDINIRDWKDIIWAISTRMDPVRDTLLAEGKMGMDATNKMEGETNREWGKVMAMDAGVERRVDELLKKLGI